MRGLPEIHVYYDGVYPSQVLLRDDDGREIDLTDWKVGTVERKVVIGEIAKCAVTFFAHLVEHKPERERPRG